MKKIGIILFLILSLFPIYRTHAENSSAGFVSANIWYSKDPFSEGDKIKIYTFIFNPDKRELSGAVVFFNKTVFLGKKNFVVPGNGANEIYIDWTATVGDHEIFGKIESAKFLISAGKYEEVYIVENETEHSKRTVSKTIIPNSNDNINSVSDSISGSAISDQIQNIEKIVKENTLEFISKPLSLVADKVEEFRAETGATISDKKEAVQAEIDVLKKPTDLKTYEDSKLAPKETEPAQKTNPLLTPFKYAELFFFKLASLIFNNKIVFYGILGIAIFFLLRVAWRFIWRLF